MLMDKDIKVIFPSIVQVCVSRHSQQNSNIVEYKLVKQFCIKNGGSNKFENCYLMA